MNQIRRGVGTNMIVGIIALVVVIGVGAYFASDVFKTKVDSQMDQFTKWTPENIAKDPENYLNFCEENAKKAITKLDAEKVAVAQRRAEFTSMQEDAEKQVKAGDKVLDELKTLYKTADAANAWPVEFSNKKLKQDELKSAIVDYNRKTERQRTRMNKAVDGLKKLETITNKIDKAQKDAKDQIEDIKVNREAIKVNKLNDDIKKSLISMKGAVQGVVDIANDSGLPTLEDLSSDTTVVKDEEFNKIMGK